MGFNGRSDDGLKIFSLDDSVNAVSDDTDKIEAGSSFIVLDFFTIVVFRLGVFYVIPCVGPS